MLIDISGISETGLVRNENQDRILIRRIENSALLVVADGIGGHYKGGMASEMIVDAISQWWDENCLNIENISITELIFSLEKSIRGINSDIFYYYAEENETGGSTLSVLIIKNDSYGILNAGDSRIYIYKNDRVRQITQDDVWENEHSVRLMNGDMDLSSNESYGKLTNYVGMGEEVNLFMRTGMIFDGMFFLCSDGVYRNIDWNGLEIFIKEQGELTDFSGITAHIKAEVYRNGADDNLSLVSVMTVV